MSRQPMWYTRTWWWKTYSSQATKPSIKKFLYEPKPKPMQWLVDCFRFNIHVSWFKNEKKEKTKKKKKNEMKMRKKAEVLKSSLVSFYLSYFKFLSFISELDCVHKRKTSIEECTYNSNSKSVWVWV